MIQLTLLWLGTLADIGTTLWLVRKPQFREANPLYRAAGAAMIRALLVLALCAPALAQTPCTSHECSDDSATPPIAGNEPIVYDIILDIASYEFTYDDGATVCATVAPQFLPRYPGKQRIFQRHWLAGYPLCYPPPGVQIFLRVRSCDHDHNCSAWSTERVEYIGQLYRCFSGAQNSEVPCNFQGGSS